MCVSVCAYIHMYVYIIYTHIYICKYVHICIYIYVPRETRKHQKPPRSRDGPDAQQGKGA